MNKSNSLPAMLSSENREDGAKEYRNNVRGSRRNDRPGNPCTPLSRTGPSSSGRRSAGYVYVSVPALAVAKKRESVKCCSLIYHCLPRGNLGTFVLILVAGIISMASMYWYNEGFPQYRFLQQWPLLNTFHDHDYNRSRVQPSNNSVIELNFDDRVYRQDLFTPQQGFRLKRCTIPILNPIPDELKSFITYPPRPNCATYQDNLFSGKVPFFLRNGTLLVRNAGVEASRTQGCCYQPFNRSGESNYYIGAYIGKCKNITNDITHIPGEILYVELICGKSGGEPNFRDGFALIPKRDQVEGRVKKFESVHKTSSSFSQQNKRLSVLILGLDSTSHMNFLRALPKSNKYLLETLSAISLRGYTKVAENTLPNVVPLLTGRTLKEFKRLCVDESRGIANVHLDGCPFIWKVFARNGYRTGFAEDDTGTAIFNMDWANAFDRPPTDYYMRPIARLMYEEFSFNSGLCYGPSLSFDKLLENVRSMAEVFRDHTYFQFTFATRLSHDDLNKLRWGDDSLLEMLQYLYTGNYLNNTALLIIGDHGSRQDKIRNTTQGKLEDKMPVAYIVLPKWFQTKYHGAYQNLKKNSNRIASAFDVHKTLYNFLNLDSLLKMNQKAENKTGKDEDMDTIDTILLPNQEKVSLSRYRGLSLFTELPENRTCFEAGIPLHWCICHKKIPMDKENAIGRVAAEFVVSSLNVLMKKKKQCSKLYLNSVDQIFKWDPKNCGTDDFEKMDIDIGHAAVKNETSLNSNAVVNGNASRSTAQSTAPQKGALMCSESKVIILDISFTTTPGNATFETTVIQLPSGMWRLTEGEDVVRKNGYDDQSWCVEQNFKPYCYCLDLKGFFAFFYDAIH